MRRLIVANLDCEADHAHLAPRPLPVPVRARISAAGSLLAALGAPGDTLWTPAPVDRERVRIPAAASIAFVSGPLPHEPPQALLCWGHTRATARLRKRSSHADPGANGAAAPAPRPEPSLAPWPAPPPWIDALWQLHADPAIARRCNDRRYALALCRELGLLLPGAALLTSVDQLTAHLAAGHHRHGHAGAWVLEAPFSASGRLRLRRRGADLDPAARTRAERLFQASGALIFQPWMDRIADIGCVGLIHDQARWQVFPPHQLDNDASGVFRAVTVHAGAHAAEHPGEHAGARQRVHEVAHTMAARLAHDGYRGPFGIDAFVYRDRDGQPALHPLCEINARMSFGLLAHALAHAHSDRSVRLRVSSGVIPAGPDIVPLLDPGDHDATSAWLELSPPRG